MLDADTFLTTLYVEVDDFCKAHARVHPGRGRPRSLSRSEVVTLALIEQFGCFMSETHFHRYCAIYLRKAFPKLPHRSQLNRLIRSECELIVSFFLHLADRLRAHDAAFQALDCTAVPVRNSKRRGYGWLPGRATLGWSNRRGWFTGFRVISSVTPEGAVAGFGIASGHVNDHLIGQTFLALRAYPMPGYYAAVGRRAMGPYLADSGFAGENPARIWKQAFGASVLAPPQRNQRTRGWTPQMRRWIAGLRQMVETQFSKFFWSFRLERERPHTMEGFQARVAATAALHNFCIWLNRQLGRPNLAFADLVVW
jgi:hypothetical protein